LIVIGAVFTQHYDAPGPIASAMHTLRINAVAFVYERAALSTLLLVLMALDRMMERWRLQQGRMPGQEGEQTLPDEGKHQGADEQRDEAVARLAEQVAMLTHSLTQISTTVTEVKTTVTQITQDRKGLALSEPIPIHARIADATKAHVAQDWQNEATHLPA
jgi:hypothetical protein